MRNWKTESQRGREKARLSEKEEQKVNEKSTPAVFMFGDRIASAKTNTGR